MNEPLILIGGGGHCISCIDVIESTRNFTIHGVIDVPSKLNTKVLDWNVIGVDDDITQFTSKNFSFLVTIGFIENVRPRVSAFERLTKKNAAMPVIASESAIISTYSTIEMGTIVMHNAIVNAGVRIGKNVIINSGALVEHNSIVGDHSHISTGAIINGDCTIGEKVFVGSNSVIINGSSIANDVIIGAGSVVIHSIKEAGVYVGNPVKKIR